MPHDIDKARGVEVDEPLGVTKLVGEVGVFTPCSTGALERVVRMLNHYYPQRTGTECREALALMYGHESWDMLETAALCGEPSAWDEDEPDVSRAARRDHQARIALTHFAGVTEDRAAAAARIEKDLAAAAGLSISRRHDPYWRRLRVDRARYAYSVEYAKQSIDEIRPSARDRYAIPANDQGLHLSIRVELLPRALTAWMERRPRFGRLGERIATFHIRQHSQCDLLKFAFAWGEACIAHPAEIPEALQIYPLVLCAKWYGWNACADTAPHTSYTVGGPIAQCRRPACAAAMDPTLQHQQTLLRAQPREDVAALSAAVRERQLEAGYTLLRQHMQEAAASQPICHFISKPAWGAQAARQALN
ncbi:MAG: hypothetical protein ACM3RQ_00735 [Methanocella sp.]